MTYCPPDCPNRALHCHRECPHYLKAYILHTLTDKRAARRASTSGVPRGGKRTGSQKKRSQKYGDKEE